MEPTLNDSVFDEAFKIITSDKSKANSLRQLFLKDNKDDNDLNSKAIEYLGEFEYDLKTLFDILRDLKLSFHEIRNTSINSNKNKDTNIKEENDINKKYFNDFKTIKKERLYLNDSDIFGKMPNEVKKTYSITSKRDNNNNSKCSINEYYIDSYSRRKSNDNNNRTLPRSLSCKSYIGNWDSNNRLELSDINNINNKFNFNTNRMENECRNLYENKYYNRNRLLNDKDTINKYYDSFFSNDNMPSNNKTLKLNFDYDNYLTDYSLNKTNKKNEVNNVTGDNRNNSRLNINLSDINNKNDINNNNNIIYSPNNIIQIENNNENDINMPNVNKNNLFAFSEHKNNDYTVTFDPQKMPNINNDNSNNLKVEVNEENNINENYNSNNYNNKRNNFNDIIPNNNKKEYIPNNNYNNLNNKYIFRNDDEEDLYNNKNKENDPNYLNNNNNKYENYIRQKYSLNPENSNINKNYKKQLSTPDIKNTNNYFINNLNNNNMNDDNDNDNNNNNKMNYKINKLNNNNINNNNYSGEEYDDNLEQQKKTIIKNIMSEIFKDTYKLDLLKRELGDDIGQKLLSENISEEQLYKVAEILNSYQSNKKDDKKKSQFMIKKYNQPSDKILLKETLDNKRYNYREYPRGWNSTKEFFINNGSTFLKDSRKKKIKK